MAMDSPRSGTTTSTTRSTPRSPANGRAITPISGRSPHWPRRCAPVFSMPAPTRQFGNRALGDRPSQSLSPGQLAVKAALALGSPYTAMLFMGEEWGASTPFQFFSSHPEPELAKATAEGRKAEFAEHGWDADEIPDPQDPETFLRSKLNWDEVQHGEHARLLEFYRALITLRRNEPDLADPWLDHLGVDFDEEQRWITVHRGGLRLACNLGTEPARVPLAGEVVLAWGEPKIGTDSSVLEGHSVAILRCE